MTCIAKKIKLKWLISIISLLGIIALSVPMIVSCGSTNNESPKQEVVPPPVVDNPNVPQFDSLDKELEWLWNENISVPITKYFESYPNREVTVRIINESKPFESQKTFNKQQFTNGTAKQDFIRIMKPASIIGINYFQIFDDKNGILIPGYESSILYGPWGDTSNKDWPSLLQAQLKWVRTK